MSSVGLEGLEGLFATGEGSDGESNAGRDGSGNGTSEKGIWPMTLS